MGRRQTTDELNRLESTEFKMSEKNWFVSLEVCIRSEYVRLLSLQSCSEYWPSPSSCSGLSNSFFRSKPFESESNHLRIVWIQNEKPPFVDHHESLPTRSNNRFIPNHENCRIETKRIKSKPTLLIVESFHIERMLRSIEVEPNKLVIKSAILRTNHSTCRKPQKMKPPHLGRQKRFQWSWVPNLTSIVGQDEVG